MLSVTSEDKAGSVIDWLRNNNNVREAFFSSLSNLSSENFQNIATGVTHLYLTQSKEDIINEGKEVDQENFFVWNPLGNIDDYNLDEIDNWEEMMDFRSDAYSTSYRVLFRNNGKFIVNVTRSTMAGTQTNHFTIDPFESVSVYFEVKNEHIGVEDHTVAMPGVYLAWLIEVREREAIKAFKNYSTLVAGLVFPANSLTNALRAGNYMKTLWNGFVLTKTLTDELLKSKEIRTAIIRNFSKEFLNRYGKASKIIDVAILFKDYADKKYLSVTNDLIKIWDNTNQENKENFKNNYPKKFEILKKRINLLRQ